MKLMFLTILFLSIQSVYLLKLKYFSSGRNDERNVTPNYETKYLDVPVDHFSFTNNATFKLRYLINDTYWDKLGPIFFYTGNEGDINLFAQNTGFIFEIAPQFKSLIVFAEHRYYGTSMPFGNNSYSDIKHLGYLTSQQALADYVFLINHLQNTLDSSVISLPVVAFGGSYGGMLAAWFRMKYPATVVGAIAASAPIWQFTGITPCDRFNTIVTEVFRALSQNDCSIPISKSWKAIRNITSTDKGKAWLSQNWNLCDVLKTQADVDNVIDWLNGALVDMAMANYPYENDFLAPVPGNVVRKFCSTLEDHAKYDDDDQLLLKNIGKALQVFTNYSQTVKCNKLGDPDSLGIDGWNFQSCTEMIMPMCSTDNDMFENSPWNFTQFSETCTTTYGVVQTDPLLPIWIYGGKNINTASNIVFSNGLLDPWSGGGVLSNISASVSAIIIPEGAHHIDLRYSNPNDPDSVRKARQFHIDNINHWLNIFYKKNAPNVVYEVVLL